MTQLLDYDTRDDRQEIRRLVGILHPATRWRFLEWCATRCKTVSGKRPGIIAEGRTADRLREAIRVGGVADEEFSNEVYVHIWNLHVAWQLSLDEALAKLVTLARVKESRRDLEAELRCSSAASSMPPARP